MTHTINKKISGLITITDWGKVREKNAIIGTMRKDYLAVNEKKSVNKY